MDEVRQEPAGEPQVYRLTGRGYCIQPARAVGGGNLGVNAGPLIGGDGAHFHQGINKKPQARLGRHTAGAGMG